MYKKQITPTINETIYNGIRSLIGYEMKQFYLSTDKMIYHFTNLLRKYFNMNLVAWLLGISERTLYRAYIGMKIQNTAYLESLIHEIITSADFKEFIYRCNQNGIMVNTYEAK